MAFIIRTKKEATYELDYKGGKLTVRPLSNSESSKLRKGFVKTKTTRFGEKENLDSDGFLIARFQRSVFGWDFLDEDHNPVPCTDEAKKDFVDLNLMDAIDIINQIEELGAEEAKDVEKN